MSIPEFEEVQLGNEIEITFYDESTPPKEWLLPLMDYEPQGQQFFVGLAHSHSL